MYRNAIVRTSIIVIIAAAFVTLTAASANAQAFADLKSALVDYSKADFEPVKACEMLGNFKSKDIVSIAAKTVPADAAAPAP